MEIKNSLYLVGLGKADHVSGLLLVWVMAISVVEFSIEGYNTRKVSGKKSTVVNWNHWILQIGVIGRCHNCRNLTS